jgi:hypothetical protein
MFPALVLGGPAARLDGSLPQPVEVIGPFLDQPAPFVKKGRAVVGPAVNVPNLMGKLHFDDIDPNRPQTDALEHKTRFVSGFCVRGRGSSFGVSAEGAGIEPATDGVIRPLLVLKTSWDTSPVPSSLDRSPFRPVNDSRERSRESQGKPVGSTGP